MVQAKSTSLQFTKHMPQIVICTCQKIEASKWLIIVVQRLTSIMIMEGQGIDSPPYSDLANQLASRIIEGRALKKK